MDKTSAWYRLLGPYGGRKSAPTYQGWWRHVWTEREG